MNTHKKCYYLISEFCGSLSKWVFEQKPSHENKFDLNENKPVPEHIFIWKVSHEAKGNSEMA